METKEFKDSPLEMPISCKTILEKVEREIKEEDEQEEAADRKAFNKKTQK